MNTTEKMIDIRRAQQLVAGGKWILAVGFFDPMTAAQAERLAALAGEGQNIIAVVKDGPGMLLPPAARARLLAALRSVSAVLVATNQDWRSALGQTPIDEDDAGERRRSADFRRLVAETR